MIKLTPTTTDKEDRAFELHCSDGMCTFQSAIKFLRRKNTPNYREWLINQVIPKRIREQVRTQCNLEGLI